MAREVDQSKLPVYTGKFAWSTDELCTLIKAVKLDYDRFDPKTWPVITSQYLQEQLGHTYTGARILPPYVAYERKLVQDCVALREDEQIEGEMFDGSVKKYNLFFHHFPFVYNNLGRARHFEYMRADHYVAWVQSMTGKIPETHTKGKHSSSQIDSYDEILEMIREAPPGIDAEEVDGMKQALAAAQFELTKQMARADTAEKAVADNKDAYERELAEEKKRTEALAQSGKDVKEALQKSLADNSVTCAVIQANLDQCRKWNNVALNEAKRASTMTLVAEKKKAKMELDIKGKELQAARAEAATAKEQITNIRDAMKKAKEMKREASCDHADGREKRVKVEGEY